MIRKNNKIVPTSFQQSPLVKLQLSVTMHLHEVLATCSVMLCGLQKFL